MNTETPVVELEDYYLAPQDESRGFAGVNFCLQRGEVVALRTERPADGRMLMRALATWVSPLAGVYRFMGTPLDFSDYRSLLPIKAKIGYIGSDASMISNRSVRENLLLQRFYWENRLGIDLHEKARSLCRQFDILNKLDMRAAQVNSRDYMIAICIRELTKSPEMVLFSQPEDFIGHAHLEMLVERWSSIVDNNITVVVFSYDDNIIDALANRTVTLETTS
jgi:polar amino acid transport system ATP-binding protein